MLLPTQFVYFCPLLCQCGRNAIQLLLCFEVFFLEALDRVQYVVELLAVLRKLTADAVFFVLQVTELLVFHLLIAFRSEEHTSELQSLMRISYAVFCLKKKKHIVTTKNNKTQAN